MSLRGRPARSIAWAATISACVESRPPETPMTTFGSPIAAQPLLQAGDLDVVGLVAVEARAGRGRRARTGSARPRAAGRGRSSGGSSVNADAAERAGARGVGAPVVVEGPHPHALLAQQVEVDVGDRAPVAVAGSGRSRRAARRSRRSSSGRPRTGRWSTRPARPRRRRRRPGSASDCRAAQQLAVLGAADGDRAAGEVEQHGRARRAPPPRSAAPGPTCPRRSRRGRRGPGRPRRRTAGPGRTARRRRRARISPRSSSPGAICRRS